MSFCLLALQSLWYAGTEIAANTMRSLARIVLTFVILFVLGVTVLLIARSRTAPVERAQPSVAKADLQMKQVEIEEQAGSVRWRLKADQALVFEQEGHTALRKVDVVVHDRDRTWTIMGDEGDVREPQPKVRDIEVRGNVEVTSSDGMRLETSVLRWQGATKRLWTDVPVRLVRRGTVIDGTAFELTMGNDEATVEGRVHATFTKGSAE